MNIIFYSKTGCPWGDDARRFLQQSNIAYEEREMNSHPEFKAECENKTGQSKCPTFDIDGHILKDSSAEELKVFLQDTKTL